MAHIVIGAGQIGKALVHALHKRGIEVVVIRQSSAPVPGARTVTGDVLDHEMLARECAKAEAVYHCIHASYDHRVWRRELPQRERAVMDAAADADIPVIFPESVYAWGDQASHLTEGSSCAPRSPLGEVRAELLLARAAHPARTASVVASDLFGPTAADGSVLTLTVLRPIAKGKRAWIPADLDAPHSWTYLPDLAEAMIATAAELNRAHAQSSPVKDLVLHAPTGEPRPSREVARAAAVTLGTSGSIASVPEWVLAAGSPFSPMIRELHSQRYLWRKPCVLQPGILTQQRGLHPTPWPQALATSVAALQGA